MRESLQAHHTADTKYQVKTFKESTIIKYSVHMWLAAAVQRQSGLMQARCSGTLLCAWLAVTLFCFVPAWAQLKGAQA